MLRLAADENFNNDIIRGACFFHHEGHEEHEGLRHHSVVVTIFVDEVKTFQRDQSEPLFCNIRQEGAVL